MAKSEELLKREVDDLIARINPFLRPVFTGRQIIEVAIGVLATGLYRMNEQEGPQETSDALGTFITTVSSLRLDYLKSAARAKQQEQKNEAQRSD